jgi:putative ABC transport system permease protein
MISRLLLDARYAARTIARQPALTLTIVLTLAVGTAATIAIFGVVDAALVRPLPYPEPDRLTSLVQVSESFGTYGFAPPFLADLRERTGSFEELAGFSPSWSMTLTGAGEPHVLVAAFVSDGLLEMLGVQPVAGRLFTPAEHAIGGPRVALVSRGFWSRQMRAGVALSQQMIRLDGAPFTVVGIVADVAMPITSSTVSDNRSSAEVWLPFAANPYAQARQVPMMNVIGRLRADRSFEQAAAELAVVHTELAAELPEAGLAPAVAALPLAELVARASRPTVLMLFAAAGLLLVIACANVANLMLNRTLRRGHEIAIRASLGAGRRRIIQQVLIDSLVVAVPGVGLGFLLSAWLLWAVPALGIQGLPPSAEVRIDARVASFAILLALGTAMAFGSVPAAFASRLGAVAGLRNAARESVGGSGKARSAFVVAEVALAMVLLVGSGLLARSFWQLTRVDPGFRAERLLAVPLELTGEGTRAAPERVPFLNDLLGRLAELPGVEEVSAVNRLPLGGSNVFVGVEAEGEPSPDGRGISMDRRVVTPGYFGTMGIGLLAGRELDARDGAGTLAPAAILNEPAARLLWPDRQALDRRLRLILQSGPGPWLTVVGVVDDVRHHGLDEAPRPEVYLSYAEASVETMVAVLRGPSETERLIPLIKDTVWSFDPDMALDGIRSVEAVADASVSEPRLRALLLTAFASLALLLAAVGVAGVISFSVAQGTRDIGVRVALGAQDREILWMTVRQGLALGVLGAGLGLAASLALGRLLEAFLFQVAANDPLTLATVAAGLLVIVAAASYLPARRATGIDPIEALRAN